MDDPAERIAELEAQNASWSRTFTRHSSLIKDLYALLKRFEDLGKQALWDGRQVKPEEIKYILQDTPNERERLADPEAVARANAAFRKEERR